MERRVDDSHRRRVQPNSPSIEPVNGARALWIVVTCMGRLAHLRFTAPPLIDSGRVGYCLVDYSCPDAAGDWLENSREKEVASGHVRVVRCPGERVFHKTRALNLGAREALRAGARLLCFADADTLFRSQTLESFERRAEPGCFLIAGRDRDGRSRRSVSGVLVVGAADFERSGGYEEAFIGWGSEDIAMRLKLHLVSGLVAIELDAGAISAIPHSDRARTRFAADSDLRRSAAHNEALLAEFVRGWSGRPFRELPASARALLFHR